MTDNTELEDFVVVSNNTNLNEVTSDDTIECNTPTGIPECQPNTKPVQITTKVNKPISTPKKGKGRPVVGKGNGKKMGPMSQHHRDKISKSKILSRLINHAEGTLSPAGVAGNQEMSATQVTAALSLLDRVLPKLSSTEIKADVRTEKAVNQIKIISVEPDDNKSDE